MKRVMPILQGRWQCVSNDNGGARLEGQDERDAPSLHVRLPMLLRGRIVELQRADTLPSHQEEGNVLEILNILFVGVLHIGVSGFRGDNNHGQMTLTLKILRMSLLLTTDFAKYENAGP